MSDDSVMSFRDYVFQMGGSGIIYDDECKEIMERWNTADWEYVSDYIAPIVAELVTETSDEYRELYNKLMPTIKEVYDVLAQKTTYYPGPTKPNLRRIK